MEKSVEIADFDQVTIVYHDNCADGFFSAAQFYLMDYLACQERKSCEDSKVPSKNPGQQILKQIFFAELTKCEKYLTKKEAGDYSQVRVPSDQELEISTELKSVSGKIDKIEPEFESQFKFLAYAHYKEQVFITQHEQLIKTEFIPKKNESEIRRLIFLVDLSPKTLVDYILSTGKYTHIIVVDHHKSAEEKLFQKSDDNLVEAYSSLTQYQQIQFIYTKKKSAAFILYSTLFKPYFEQWLSAKKVAFLNELVYHVSIGDICGFDQRSIKTRKIKCAVFGLFVKVNFRPKETQFWKILNYDCDMLELLGASDYNRQEAEVESAVKRARKVILKKNNEKAYMAVGKPFIKSWLGEILSQKALDENWGKGIGIVIDQKKVFRNRITQRSEFRGRNYSGGRQSAFRYYTVGFRACSKSEIDLNQVASLYGGGGHPKAAGCKVDRLEDLIKIPKI